MLVDRHVLALFFVCACPTSRLSVGFVDLHLVRTAWPDTRQDYHLFPFTSASLIVLLFSRWIGQPSIIWIRLLHFRLPRKTFLKLRGCCRLLFFCISFITLRRSPLVYIFFCPMLPFSWLLRHFIQSSERKTWNAKIGKHKLWTWCNGGTTTYTWLSY